MGKKAAHSEVNVLLVCGLPGSGKSTLTSHLVRNGWVRISQDELGTQAECTKVLEKSLKHKKSVVVDRCMVTPSERKLWVQRARAMYKEHMRIETVFMDVPVHLCKVRVSKRKDHPTLGPEGTDVVDQFARGMRMPDKWEGPYDDCFVMKSEKHVKELLPRYLNPQCLDKSAVPVSKDSGWEQAPKSAAAKSAAKETKGYKGEVFMVRHGERTDRTGGTVDNPDDCAITSKGRHQARQAGEYISGMTRTKIKAVYSSPFLRCVETAAEIAGQVGVPHLQIEPGLAELYAERLFNGQPMLTTPATTFRTIEQRCHISINASTPPVASSLPKYPEARRDANKRITDTVAKLLQAHTSDSIVLVMHSHGLVTATANIPKAHKSIASSRPDYCGLTHIDAALTADVVTDVSYRGMVSGTNMSTFLADLPQQPPPSAGKWGRTWDWLAAKEGKVPTQDEAEGSHEPEEEAGEEEEAAEGEEEYRISEVLDLKLEEAAAMYPRFGKFYNQGDELQKAAFRRSWDAGEEKIRKKVSAMISQGMFNTPKMVDHTRPVEQFRMISLDMQSFKKDQVSGAMQEMQKAQPDVICLQNVTTDAAQQTTVLLGRYNMSSCTAGKRSVFTFALKSLSPIFHNAVLVEGHTVTFCTVYHEQATVVVFNGVMFSAAHTDRAAAMMGGNLKSLGDGCVAVLASDSSLSTMDPPAGYTPCTKGANVVLAEGRYSIDAAMLLHPIAFGHSGVDLVLVLEKVQGVDKGMPKFPRTQHLYSVGKGSVGRDDLLLAEGDAKAYHTGKVVVEEKIDGSNLGIFFNEEMHIVCMNRGKVVTAGSGSQWGKLDTWLEEKRSELFSLLGHRFILYGEWMVARHSISYTRLPDYFITFDVYDRRAKRFLGVRPRNEMIKGTTLPLIRPISTGVHPTRDAFVSLITTQSYYTSATIEGVYLRLDTPDGLWLDKRAKIVNTEFMEGIEEGHWQKRVMEKNTLKY